MIALQAPSVERALAAISARAWRLVRASRLEIALPPDVLEVSDPSSADVVLMAIDAAGLEDAAGQVASLPAGRTIAWTLPTASAGVVSWALARARRLQPVPLEDACDALRHAGVIDVRVTTVSGALPIAVITGKTTA